MLACTFIGSEETLRKNISGFIEESGINELMVSSNIFDINSKLKSLSVLNAAMRKD
jgi:hypothetical protein